MTGFWKLSISRRQFARELYSKIESDDVFNGAAALAYYLMFAIFPAMIFLLTIIPYLPIPNVHQAVMEFIRQALPGEAAGTFEGVVSEITGQRRSGLLSFGLLATLWAASSGLYAVMRQLNITHGVKESRPFWKTRGTALLLTILFAVLIIGAFGLIIFGGVLQRWLAEAFGFGSVLLFVFALFRWVVITLLLLSGFGVTYYFGPNVEQKFKLITPGSVAGVIILALASMGFRLYVANFGDYGASYGSLGAVIILMLWLYIVGFVLLLGSEVDTLTERFALTEKEEKICGKESPRHRSGRRVSRFFRFGL